jgi:hypothetical protein
MEAAEGEGLRGEREGKGKKIAISGNSSQNRRFDPIKSQNGKIHLTKIPLNKVLPQIEIQTSADHNFSIRTRIFVYFVSTNSV